MMTPSILLAAAAVALSLGVAIAADRPSVTARSSGLAEAGDALRACLRGGDGGAGALRWRLGPDRRE